MMIRKLLTAIFIWLLATLPGSAETHCHQPEHFWCECFRRPSYVAYCDVRGVWIGADYLYV